MNHVIDQLCRIETQAVQVLAAAKETQERLKAEHSDRIRRFDAQTDEQTKELTASVRKTLEEDCHVRLERQKQEADAFLFRLETHYQDKHKEYVERLFREMTEV